MKSLRKKLKNILLILIGCLLFALSFSLFLAPCRIAPGGISGLALIIHTLTGFPVGLCTVLLNLPLLIAAHYKFGPRFIGMTVFATIVSSFLIDATSFLPAFTDDLLLASLYGGLLMGAGLGFVFLGGATTGGTDILGKLLRLKFPWLRQGQMLLLVDAAVIAVSPLAFGDINRLLYAVISLYVGTVLIDGISYRFDFASFICIITDKPDDIARVILDELDRGVTFLNGRGGYTGNPKDVLLCALKRTELPRLQDAVRSIDPGAFLIAMDAHQVYGDGFTVHGR